MINRHQRCGYSDSPFARIHYFYTAGSRNGLEVVGTWAHTHKKEVVPKKNTFFVIEKYVEDVKQDQKTAPDLLELIMRPTDPVKEKLRPI